MPFAVRIALGIIATLSVVGGIAWYAHRRAAFALALGSRGRRVAAWLIVGGVLALVAGRLAARLPGLEPWAVGLAIVGSVVSLSVLLAFPPMVLIDLGRMVARGAARLGTRGSLRPAAPGTEAVPGDGVGIDLGRREFVARSLHGAAGVAAFSGATYGTLYGRHDYQTEEVVVPIERLPRALDGLTLVQLSDIHFGSFVGERERRSAEELVRRAKPDLIVLTGDLVDHDPAHARQLGELIARVKDAARFGVAVIPGNHDYYAGVEAVLTAARKAGARVLVNEAVELASGDAKVALLGVDDLWAARMASGGPDIVRAARGLPEDRARVLLCHNPAYFPDAAPHVDLQLSGHTHGGQITLGWNPAEHVVPFGYIEGLYTRGGARLYVNRGFGTAGPPSRIGAPPEVTRVVLTGA